MSDTNLWDRRYLEEGHIWGDEPSQTASLLSENLHDTSQHVLEVGFGYGRDLIEMAKHGHQIVGVETAAAGLTEATRQLRKYIDSGQAHLILGEFSRAPIPARQYDAIFSHRMLHLLGDNGLVRAFANRAANILKPGGRLYVSARDPRDFNPEQMKWLDKEQTTAEYTIKGREGHRISFWNAARFEKIFGNRFDIHSVIEGEEIEAQSNPDKMSKYSIMIARKKNELDTPEI